MAFLILFFGFLFGAILQSAKLNKYDTISGMTRLEDYTVAKAIAVAVGVGAILLSIGIGLAVLNCIVFLSSVTNRVIGASTSYPYLGDLLTGITGNDYFASTVKSGTWELIFLGGAMLSGLVISLIRKDFKIQLIHSGWSKTEGKSPVKRIIWAFVVDLSC